MAIQALTTYWLGVTILVPLYKDHGVYAVVAAAGLIGAVLQVLYIRPNFSGWPLEAKRWIALNALAYGLMAYASAKAAERIDVGIQSAITLLGPLSMIMAVSVQAAFRRAPASAVVDTPRRTHMAWDVARQVLLDLAFAIADVALALLRGVWAVVCIVVVPVRVGHSVLTWSRGTAGKRYRALLRALRRHRRTMRGWGTATRRNLRALRPRRRTTSTPKSPEAAEARSELRAEFENLCSDVTWAFRSLRRVAWLILVTGHRRLLGWAWYAKFAGRVGGSRRHRSNRAGMAAGRDLTGLFLVVFLLTALALLTEPWSSEFDIVGIMWALVVAVCWLANIVIVEKAARGPRKYEFVAHSSGAAALLFHVPVLMFAGGQLSPVALGIGALAGMLMVMITSILEVKAIAAIGGASFGLFQALEPVIAALAGLALIGQTITVAQMLAMAGVSVTAFQLLKRESRRTA